MKLSSSKIYWFVGIIAVLVLLYFFILRHQGYIYFYDASGSFDFRRPFDQYMFTYTPYDGVEVGIKNRLPIMTVIALLYYPLHALFNVGPESIIKIGYVLLFLGAYTSFYYVFPRFLNIFESGDFEYRKSRLFPIFRLILSLLYVIIPVLTLRLSMLHMFYMTTFYPIVMYVFIKFFIDKKFSFKYLILLILFTFFGFSYSNVIIYYLYSFIIFGIIIFFTTKGIHSKLALIVRAITSGSLVVASQLYWIIPYFLKGSPSPGYVVTTAMVNALSVNNTASQVLFGASEWFIGQGENIRIFFAENPILTTLQLAGILSFYVFVLLYLFTANNKKFVLPVFFLIIVPVLFAISKGNPIYSFVNEFLVYQSYGWVFRETSRIYFLAIFWMFLFFSYGIVTLRFRVALAKNILEKYSEITLLFITTILLIIYSIPIFLSVMNFLKPSPIPDELIQVNKILAEDHNYGYVLRVPAVEEYRLSWVDEKFSLADTINYRYFPYLLNRPPVQNGGVIPVTRTKESLVSEMLLYSDGFQAEDVRILTNFGIKYILFDKQAKAIYWEDETNEQEVLDVTLKESKYLEKVNSNDLYDLYKVRSEEEQLQFNFENKKILFTSNMTLLQRMSQSSFAGREFVPYHYSDYQISNTDEILVDKNDKHYYLDYLDLENREKYISYPYDHTVKFSIPVDWGRASPLDKGGASLSFVFRNHGIRVYQYTEDDKITFSNEPLFKEGSKSELKYTQNISCSEDCDVYAKVLYSKVGGKLKVQVGKYVSTLNLKQNSEGFYWTKLVESKDFDLNSVEILLENTNGFAAVGGILVLPHSEVTVLKDEISKHNVYVIPTDADNYAITESLDPNCRVDELKYINSFIPKVYVKGFCEYPVQMYLKQFQSEFRYNDFVSGKAKFADSVDIVGNFEGEIMFFSHVDLLLWVMFGSTFAAVFILVELVVLKHVQ